MAKKVRRVKKKKKARSAVADTATAEPSSEPAAEPSLKLSPAERFRQEYNYVVKDLQRVLLLSGVMFILLIVLNLLLR